jgi:hypothetical protein
MIAPVSLLARMIETSPVSGGTSVSGDRQPSARTGATTRSMRSRKASSVRSTDGCSTADVNTRRQRRAPSVPSSASAFASVAPDVNTISLGCAPISAATWSRARSIASRAARPSACSEEALPQSIQGTMASRTRGSSGVVALASR